MTQLGSSDVKQKHLAQPDGLFMSCAIDNSNDNNFGILFFL